MSVVHSARVPIQSQLTGTTTAPTTSSSGRCQCTSSGPLGACPLSYRRVQRERRRRSVVGVHPASILRCVARSPQGCPGCVVTGAGRLTARFCADPSAVLWRRPPARRGIISASQSRSRRKSAIKSAVRQQCASRCVRHRRAQKCTLCAAAARRQGHAGVP